MIDDPIPIRVPIATSVQTIVQENRYRGVGSGVTNFFSSIVVPFHFTLNRSNTMPSYESLPAESEFFNGNLFQKMVDRLICRSKRHLILATSQRLPNQI